MRKTRSRSTADNRLAFFQSFLKRPQRIASVIPSSRFLERRIVQLANASGARIAVELGPGTGGTTRALLAALTPDARLLAVELNADFVPILRAIGDPRLAVHQGNAEDLAEILAEHGLGAPDLVVSGIPFSLFSPALGRRILETIHGALAPGGRFVAYQVRDRVEVLGREVFGPPQVEPEFRNIPPNRVYSWQKPAA